MPKLDKCSTKLFNKKNDPIICSRAKGERLKRVRHLANLSREELCSDGTINITTLISWEVGRFGGLSKKGASLVIQRVAKEGVFVSNEWLLYEVGCGPTVNVDFSKISKNTEQKKNTAFVQPVKESIIDELLLFRTLNKNAIDFIVSDDSMLPNYHMGEYVAGTNRYGQDIPSLISHDCIVQLLNGQILLRTICKGNKPNHYHLLSSNTSTKAESAFIFDVELASAAPVIWHRKPEPKSLYKI